MTLLWQAQINGHHARGLKIIYLRRNQQGVTGIVQQERRFFFQHRNNRLELDAQTRNSLAQVKASQNRLVLCQRLSNLTYAGSQSGQDTFFLTTDLVQQGLNPVVAFQSRCRLDIEGLTTGRDVVHKALQATAMVRPHRDNITAVAISNQRFLKNTLQPVVLQQPIQLTLDAITFPLEAISQIGQFERSRIKNFSPRTDAASDLGSKVRERGQASRKVLKRGADFTLQKFLSTRLGGLEGRLHITQDLGLQAQTFGLQARQVGEEVISGAKS